MSSYAATTNPVASVAQENQSQEESPGLLSPWSEKDPEMVLKELKSLKSAIKQAEEEQQ